MSSEDLTFDEIYATNLFDKNYYPAAYRSGAFTYIGDARSAQLGFSAEF